MPVRVVAASGFNLPEIPCGGPSDLLPCARQITVDLKDWTRSILNYICALHEYHDNRVCTIRMNPATLELLKPILGDELDIVDGGGHHMLWGANVELDPALPLGFVSTFVEPDAPCKLVETVVKPSGLVVSTG